MSIDDSRSPDAIFKCWHVVGRSPSSDDHAPRRVTLLGRQLEYGLDADGAATVHLLEADRSGQRDGKLKLPAQTRFGFLWTCLAEPAQPLFDLPEYDEPDRRVLVNDPIGVQVSAPRAIENFLDIAHFPFVHTGILGQEAHSKVLDYGTRVTVEGELLVENVMVHQPMATAKSVGATEMAYTYRIPHPCCCLLYKRSAQDVRKDVIGLFIRPISEEQIAVHSFNCVLDARSDTPAIRAFQQTIFAQDKPILENQVPRRLPLDPHAETSIKADRASVMFRRWLKDKGMTYGTVPAR